MADQDENADFTVAELQCWLDTCYPTGKNKKFLSPQQAKYIIMHMKKDLDTVETILVGIVRERSDQQGTASPRQGDRTDKLGDTTDKLANLTVSTESARQDGVGNVAGTFAPFSATGAAPAESSI